MHLCAVSVTEIRIWYQFEYEKSESLCSRTSVLTTLMKCYWYLRLS